jgi:hypothetical protein
VILDAKNSYVTHKQLMAPIRIGACNENSRQFSDRPAVQ